MTHLIIAGAFYFKNNTVLRAHYAGEFMLVDCTEYKTKKQIKKEYSESIAKEFLSEEPIIYDGVKYFQCEYGPWGTENMDLLSDLSELRHIEENYEF